MKRVWARHGASWLGLCLLLAACRQAPPQALGTLEYDRISLPAVAAERIVAMDVHEGQRVHKGQTLAQLDPAQTQAELQAAEAQVRQQQALLDERIKGPREEDIAQARARLGSARAQQREARAYYARMKLLRGSGAIAQDDLDRARAAAGAADGEADAARAALDVLLHGTRAEQIAQTRATLAAAREQVRVQRVRLRKLRVVAPRDGVVDSIPYRLGDQAPVGAPLLIVLVGKAPYARVYLPAALRARLHDGDVVQVQVEGLRRTYRGHVRTIRREPAFTPYYALSGDDATRLSYLAQVQLGDDGAHLPAGLPVRVMLPERAR